MVVVFEHGFELIEGYSPIFVVIVLDKLLFGNFVRVLVFNVVEELQVAEDRVEEGLEGVLVQFLPVCEHFVQELFGFVVVLVEGGGGTHKLIEVNVPLPFEVDVVEDFGGLVPGCLEGLCNFFNVQEFVIVAEYFELVLEVADLVVVEAGPGLELAWAKNLISHAEVI